MTPGLKLALVMGGAMVPFFIMVIGLVREEFRKSKNTRKPK